MLPLPNGENPRSPKERTPNPQGITPRTAPEMATGAFPGPNRTPRAHPKRTPERTSTDQRPESKRPPARRPPNRPRQPTAVSQQPRRGAESAHLWASRSTPSAAAAANRSRPGWGPRAPAIRGGRSGWRTGRWEQPGRRWPPSALDRAGRGRWVGVWLALGTGRKARGRGKDQKRRGGGEERECLSRRGRACSVVVEC